MFGTKMHYITFSILVIQFVTLFTQLLYCVARPDDKSRLRFFFLILVYFIYNLISGLFPSEDIPISIILQYILGFTSGISVAVYFIYYIYQEFDIYPFRPEFFGVKPLFYTLTGSFIFLFMIPYFLLGNLERSRLLYLSIPALIAIAFFIQVGIALKKIYAQQDSNGPKYFRFKIISGYLGLFTLSALPFFLIFFNVQPIRVAILNFGFLLMMITYIVEFLCQAKQETLILAKLLIKDDAPEIQIADNILNDILIKLQTFEKDQEYLTKKITIGKLSKEFDTNGRYLSFVVNTYKEKTFTSYVNDLRIDYCKKRLREDPQFRIHYTLKAMANEIGFTSSDALTKAFYKSEKTKLSAYLKQIRSSKK